VIRIDSTAADSTLSKTGMLHCRSTMRPNDILSRRQTYFTRGDSDSSAAASRDVVRQAVFTVFKPVARFCVGHQFSDRAQITTHSDAYSTATGSVGPSWTFAFDSSA
jgi:hypothetical protein